MQIDIKTTDIKPIRQTFDNVAARIGAGKLASRYQEATFDVQATHNFHYRPYWDPGHELYDPRRTAIVMEDWYAFKDPRQFYYGTWTITRAKQQDNAERNFGFVEKRELLSLMSDDWRTRVANVLLPLRHVEYAANQNNCQIAAYGYGTAITQTGAFAMMDHLGMAQYLSRIGLLLDGNTGDLLAAAKRQWMEDETWQPLRRLVEDTMVLDDWFEAYTAQNFVINGLIYPMVYDRFDLAVSEHGGSTLTMLTTFMVDWYADSNRCVDAFMKIAAEESADNKALLEKWCAHWTGRAEEAMEPLAKLAFGGKGSEVLAEMVAELKARGEKKCKLEF